MNDLEEELVLVRKSVFLTSALATLVFIAGCNNNAETKSEETQPKQSVETNKDAATKETEDTKEEVAYTKEQIEYASIWYHLGENQAIDEFNVLLIPKGTPLNAQDPKSGVYPEDVVQLTGSRLIDGSITYSKKDEDTINIYKVPTRWDGDYTKIDATFYADIIEETRTGSIRETDLSKLESILHNISVYSLE